MTTLLPKSRRRVVRASELIGAWIGLAVFATTVFTTSEARSDDVRRTCTAAAQKGQVARDEGRLIEAQSAFVTCAQAQCPALVRKDCVAWKAELDARIPTLVIAVEDVAGGDLKDVKVTMDGQPYAMTTDGRSQPVEPGTHKLHVESTGYQPADVEVIVREGEHPRHVVAKLKKIGANTDTPKPAPPEARPMSPWPWVLAGTAVVGAGVFMGLYFSARGDATDLEGKCSPHCSDEEVDPIRTKLLVSRIALGLGAAAAVGAVVLFVSEGQNKTTVSAAADRLVVSGRF